MKRHEYLRSAILALVGAVIFLAAAILVQTLVIKPLIADDNTPLENLLFKLIPMALYIFAGLFFIAAVYAAINEAMIEKGENVIAKVTGIKEYLVGKGTGNVHYNVFCEWRDPKTNKLYKYRAKNLPTNPEQRLSDKKVVVRINPKDPRQYFVDI